MAHNLNRSSSRNRPNLAEFTSSTVPNSSLFDLSHLAAGLPTIAELPEVPEPSNPCRRRPPPRPRSSHISSDPIVDSNLIFHGDESSSEGFRIEKGNSGCHPKGGLGLLSNLITCWSHKAPESKNWERKRASALLELSKRQQAALADKQDTIDMLEWQLEQVQAMADKEHELQERENVMQRFSSQSGAGIDSGVRLKADQTRAQPRADYVQSRENLGCEGGFDSRDQTRTTQDDQPIHDTELSATLLLFEMAVIRARLSIRYFCNCFIKQMEVSGYPVCRTLAEMEPASVFLRKEHTAFVLDSRINKAFFHCFENDSFDDTGLMKILDPEKRCAARLEEYKRMKLQSVTDLVNMNSGCFEPDFFRFCQTKTKEMWALFQMSVIFKSMEEREAFTGAFLDVAKGVWLLHRLAFSMNPPVVILRVGRGMDIDSMYVEPVAIPGDYCHKCIVPKVEFMIMPGFRTHKKIIKCQVYPHVRCK